MSRKSRAKPPSPFRCFNSSPEVIRLVVMMYVRFSADRESMSNSTQALCSLAGTKSIFTGDKLLTAANAGDDADASLLAKLGLVPLSQAEPLRERIQA